MEVFDRRVYVTKAGIIGLGEHHAQKGDLVCVIKGCFRPILVNSKNAIHTREATHEEKVVCGVSNCCTYLHGYIEGKAIREIDDRKLQSCTFRLE